MSGPDDLGALVRRYHETGDESAIEELVRRTRPQLLRVARRIGSPQDAEDSVQSAYLSLARKGATPFDVMTRLGLPETRNYLVVLNGTAIPKAERLSRP